MRTSPVHYIAPSAISVIPNCNNSANDLAVTIARGAKISVYSPATGIGTNSDGNYQEWTFAGRNRRLADSTAPYTVYVRLPKEDKDKGYLVFAAKDKLETEEGEEDVWVDHYSSVVNSGNGYSVLYQDGEGHDVQNISDDYYYIRLGDVSLPEGGERSLDIDTGILGTDAYNNQWSLNPDELPLRIELSCTVGGEDAGPTPYVYWGQILTLAAKLVEGWEDAVVERFHHWEITRNSGDAEADAAWPIETRAHSFAELGQILLSHNRGAGDDFNGAVSALFTVTAMGTPDSPTPAEESQDNEGEEQQEGQQEQETVYVPLAQATVNIQPETVEKYDLQTSTDIVSFNPQDRSYIPAAGVTVSVRATDQRGNLFDITRGQFHSASLGIEYAAVGSDQWTALTVPTTPADAQAQATLPISAFQQQQSVNLRLVRITTVEVDGEEEGGEPQTETVTDELFRKTVAFVRDGEDSSDREWIFLRSTEAITFGDASSAHPLPSLITYGEVNPTGAAGHVTNESNQDGWVPDGWWDEEQGVDATNCYEYGSYRDYVKASGSTPANWGPFTTPVARNHWGRDGQDGAPGTNGEIPAALYTSRVTGTAVTAPVCTAANYMAENLPQGWSKTAPNRQVGYDVWMSQNVILTAADGTYSLKNNAWSTPVRISGDKGDPGADSSDREWIYIRTNSYPYGGTHPKNISQGEVSPDGTAQGSDTNKQQDDWVPNGWSDRALATEETAKYVYTSWRDKQAGDNQQWGDFQDPSLWSNWGVQGIDGDGVQYLFKLFPNELDATARESQKPPMTGEGAATFNDQTGEWECTGWSDDPLAPTSLLPFCYCSVIHEINGSWGAFGTLGLWSKWSEDGTSPYVADITNEMDSVACDVDGKPEQIGGSDQSVVTNFKLFHGITEEEFYISSVLPSSRTGATIVATPTTVANAATSGSLTITYAGTGNNRATIEGKDEFVVTLTAKSDSTITRQLTFTVNGVRPGANGESAVIYQLKPSMSSIPFSRNPDDSLTPASRDVGLKITKTIGSTTTEYSTATAAGVTVRYSTSAMPASASAGTSWTSGNITVANTASNLYIAMFNLSGTLLDRETIPVIKDGLKGADGEDGEDGDDGSDGWTITVNPSPIILNQKLSPSDESTTEAYTTDFGLPLDIGISAKCGNNTGTVTIDSLRISNDMGFTISRQDASTLRITRYDKINNKWKTKGTISCYVTLSYGDNTVSNVPISISAAVNLMGSFRTEIEGDVETSVANKLSFTYDGEDIDTLEEIGQFIRSSRVFEVTLSSTVNGHADDISNLRMTSDRISMSVGGWLGNLLAQTDFVSGSMEQWTVQNGSINTVQKHDGYNSYYGTVPSGSSTLDVLQQYLIYNADGIRRISEDGWFTLSFWAMGSNGARLDTFFYPSCVVESGTVIIDGEEHEYNTADYDGNCKWTLSTTWTKHTFTFRTRKTFPTGVAQFVLFRLYEAGKYCFIAQPRLEIGAMANEYKEGFQWAGIDMTRKGIRATADNFEIQNSNGTRTFYVDADGNLIGAGNATFSGNIHAVSGVFESTFTSNNGYVILDEAKQYVNYTWRGLRIIKDSSDDIISVGASYHSNGVDKYGVIEVKGYDSTGVTKSIKLNGAISEITADSLDIDNLKLDNKLLVGVHNYSATGATIDADHFLVLVKSGSNVRLPSNPVTGEMHLIRNCTGGTIAIYCNGNPVDIANGTQSYDSSFAINNQVAVLLIYDGSAMKWYANRMDS